MKIAGKHHKRNHTRRKGRKEDFVAKEKRQNVLNWSDDFLLRLAMRNARQWQKSIQ